MSLLLAIQTKDSIILGSDTAHSLMANDSIYRVHNNARKIHRIDNQLIFASGYSMVTSAVIDMYKSCKIHTIDAMSEIVKYCAREFESKHPEKVDEHPELGTIGVTVAEIFNDNSVITEIDKNGNIKRNVIDEDGKYIIFGSGVRQDIATNRAQHIIKVEKNWDMYYIFESVFEDVAYEGIGGFLNLYEINKQGISKFKDKRIKESPDIQYYHTHNLLTGTNTVVMDSVDGFTINKKVSGGLERQIWINEDGDIYANNVHLNGYIDAMSFSLNGVNFLTADGLYLDGAHIKHVVADTIDTGTLNAHVVDVKSQLADGGEIIIDGSGFRAIDKDGNTTVNIGSNGGQIIGAEIDSAPDGKARIQLKGNTFTGLTADDLASGLKFSVTDDGSTDIGLYHNGVKMINFKDGTKFFVIEPTTDALYLGLGATGEETRCYGSWNFFDTTITMIDNSGYEKFSITTVPNSSGTNTNPVITMGIGTGTGDNGKVKITKLDDGVDISYTDSTGNVKKFTANDNGIGLNHSSGSYIQLDNSGNVTIHATNNMNLSHGGTLNLDA